jgi:hypothetical protein
MNVPSYQIDVERYAKCIEVSKRVRWDIDNDVIRGRNFDFSHKFLPDGISKVDKLDFLNSDEQRWQYIFSGVEHPRFQKVYNELTTEDQRTRINTAVSKLT